MLRNLLIVSICLAALTRCSDDDQMIIPNNPGQPGATDMFAFNGRNSDGPFIIAGSGSNDLLVGFKNQVEDEPIALFANSGSRPINIVEDESGTVYNIFGVGSGGAHDGDTLKPLRIGTSFWLTTSGMYPGAALNGQPRKVSDTLNLIRDGAYDIPINSLFQGSGFDVIGTLTEPDFIDYNQRRESAIPFLLDDDEAVGVSLNGDTRLYPIPILTAFEIVNDVVGGVPIAVTYSPLSQSARVWRRPSDGFRLGVTGTLWNSAMLMFERGTSTNQYHQITGVCVTGPDRGKALVPINYVLTKWGHWKSMIQRAKVLDLPTSINIANARRMNLRIRTSQDHPFPVDYRDDRLLKKSIVLTVVTDETGLIFEKEFLAGQ